MRTNLGRWLSKVMPTISNPSRAFVCIFLFLCLWCAIASAQSDGFALRTGDTVAFYGDSITAQHLYTRFAEDFAVTRYPTLDVHFNNAGVPGDAVSGGYTGAASERVSRDVTPLHPTMITVMLGMNDGGWGYTPETVMLANFNKGYESLLKMLEAGSPRAGFTLISPTPYDEITHGTEFPGYNKSIDLLSKAVFRLAAERQQKPAPAVFYSDFNTPMRSALTCAHKNFPELAPLLIPDRIHPGEVAHWIMAATLMKSWRVNGVVSNVSLDFATSSVHNAARASVSEIRKENDGLRWTQEEDALPLPLDLNNALTPVLLACSDIANIDQEILRVEDLHKGTYDIWIDGNKVTSYSSEELKAGVNLAMQKTPMLAQARGIDWLEERRAALDQAKLVLKADVKHDPADEATQQRLSAAEAELASAIREKAKPVPHHFELKLVVKN